MTDLGGAKSGSLEFLRAWERLGEAMGRVDRKGWKLVLFFLFFFGPVCPELQIAVNVDANVMQTLCTHYAWTLCTSYFP